MQTDTTTTHQPATTTPACEIPVRVKDLPAALNHVVTIGGIRADLFNRERNGLLASGALIFRGRHILAYPSRYLTWMASNSRRGA